MRKYKILLISLSLIIIVPFSGAWAQSENDKTFQEKISKQLTEKQDKFFTITVENDLFGGDGTDENYTSGVRISYFNTAFKPSIVTKFVNNYLPFILLNDTTSVAYSLGHNLYTPRDISTRIPDQYDRPYAAFLYSSAGLTTIKDNYIDEVEITLGVVGPLALGEEIQKTVHNAIASVNPQGWDSQLENEPALILSLQRSWPEAYAMDFKNYLFRVTPHIGLALGNVYTYAASGVTFQLVPEKYRWQSQPLRVRPAIPGTGYFHTHDNTFSWSLFTGVEGRVIGRNIFLDGNSFSSGPSVDKKYVVADINAGLSMNYGKAQLSYTLNWRSKEFLRQKNTSIFGAVSLGYRF